MTRLMMIAVLLLLSACTTPVVQADVTRFHVLGAAPSPGSFTIVPDTTQVGSLEFQDYASQVAEALAAKGWRPVAPGGKADAQVSIHWGVGAPNTVTWQSPSAVYTGFGWGPRTAWGAGGWTDPFPYWETRSITYFPRWLAVEMVESGGTGRKVLFEGRAVAEGKRREIAPVVPYLVRALFTGFPGSSGSTVRVNVPIENP
ncbi:MAG TPA: DUF4136 domain-containing protein [Magnetospirillum sp.]|nr:DUF4136 domain-containing protein [Magnetospirillum sp.]